MTTEQRNAPFNENAQVFVRTDANYTMNNDVDTVDVFGAGVTVNLPPEPVFGQSHRIVAGAGAVLVSGNGHTIAGGNNNIPTLTFAEYVFSSSGGAAGQWVSDCCTTDVTPPQ
jgi:hypothetical protein